MCFELSFFSGALGFGSAGVAAGSAAAGVQSAVYGGAVASNYNQT